MEKIKILVAQHKEAEVFHNEVYIPIHVGKALSKQNLVFSVMIRVITSVILILIFVNLLLNIGLGRICTM